jgi:hypothetical protein
MLAVAALLAALTASAAGAQSPGSAPTAPAEPRFTFSGLVFGDYFYFGEHHDPDWQGEHGLWLRRIYLTADYAFTPAISTRVRLEMNSNGQLGDERLTPYVKDAYVRWTFWRRQAVTVGIQPTLSFNYVESAWGLRHIEKTPLDLYQWDSSRDTGITVGGRLGDAVPLTWALQYGNDQGSDADPDTYQAVRASARVGPSEGLTVEGVFARLGRSPEARRTTGQVFAGYAASRGRAGFQYAFQTRRPGAGSGLPDRDLSIYSGFGVVHVMPQRLSLFARVDRHDGPCPDGADIDYLPISPDAPFTLTLAGVEYFLHPSVRFSPNVEWVRYSAPSDPGAPRPGNDVVWRATFYWAW